MSKPVDPAVYYKVYGFTEWLESGPGEIVINGHLINDVTDLLMAAELHCADCGTTLAESRLNDIYQCPACGSMFEQIPGGVRQVWREPQGMGL